MRKFTLAFSLAGLLLSAASAWATNNGCGGGDVYVPYGDTENFSSLQIDPSAEACSNGWISFNNADIDGQAVIAAGNGIYFYNLYSDTGYNGAVLVHPGGELEAAIIQQGAFVEFISVGGLFQLDNPAQSSGGYVEGSSTDNGSSFCTAGYCATPEQIANGLMDWPTPLTGGPSTYETHIIWENPSWNYMVLQVRVDDQHYNWGAWSQMDCEGYSYKLLNTDAPWLTHGYHYQFRVGYSPACTGQAVTVTNTVAVNP